MFKGYTQYNTSSFAYSVVPSFTTLGRLVLSSPTSADLTPTGATLGGNLTSNVGTTITELGVVFAPAVKNENPVLNGPHTTTVLAVGTAEGVFTVAVGGLDPSTTYVFRAYAKGGPAAGYSESANFSTGDSGFGVVGRGITHAIPLPDGKTLVAGGFSSIGGAVRHNIARLLADGTVDPAFTAGTGSGISSLGLQGDSKILIGGCFSEINGVAVDTGLARLMADGTTDPGFSAETFSGSVEALAVQADGRILIGGTFVNVGGTGRAHLARLEADGDLDLTFNPGANERVTSLAVQPDGKILAAGSFTQIASTPRNRIARLLATGAVDTTFDPGDGADDEIDAVALTEDGSILIGGVFRFFDSTARGGLARTSSTNRRRRH